MEIKKYIEYFLSTIFWLQKKFVIILELDKLKGKKSSSIGPYESGTGAPDMGGLETTTPPVLVED